jgi:hypothetical protein
MDCTTEMSSVMYERIGDAADWCKLDDNEYVLLTVFFWVQAEEQTRVGGVLRHR